MAVLQEFKCPCCDGSIEFSSDVQKMKCPYCDTEFEMETLLAYDQDLHQQTQESMTWDTAAGGEWTEGETAGLRVYVCQNCAGEIITDETKKTMKKILSDIQDGTFAKDFLLDMSSAGAQVHFNAMRKKASAHPSEVVGADIRKLYSWSDEDKLINN